MPIAAPPVYTVITFAPIQGFIEKSRKLRDLYGSSYLLSLLSWSICQAAERANHQVISPALHNIAQGLPNLIIVKGAFDRQIAETAFNQTWESIVIACRNWVEAKVQTWGTDPQTHTWHYAWSRNWNLWASHTWEFFWAQGKPADSITEVRDRLNRAKQSRNWTGVNWTGESSTLSGTDAIAYPGLGRVSDPRHYDYQTEKQIIQDFYQQLSDAIGEAFIDPREQLSIPELIKRLVTHEEVARSVANQIIQRLSPDSTAREKLQTILNTIAEELNPISFKELNRLKRKRNPQDPEHWTGWYLGDGDRAGDYLKHADERTIHKFSQDMRTWDSTLKTSQKHAFPDSRLVYAGGDDFFGVLYQSGTQLQLKPCVDWFSQFKSDVWNQPKPKDISVSVGFVWAGPKVPQREVLQHCRAAEKSAKDNGRDRIACRILFNSGNYLEWICPWWVLEKGLLNQYCDRSDRSEGWAHLYQDVAALEARHAFEGNQTDVAIALFQSYFRDDDNLLKPDNWWNTPKIAGILGDRKHFELHCTNPQTGKVDRDKFDRHANRALNNWVIDLAKVGFYIHRDWRSQDV